jgi:hypothetical protein
MLSRLHPATAGSDILTANVLFPMSDSGLRPGVTPVIGFDYALK